MRDEDKSRERLVAELEEMRRRLAEVESAEAARKSIEKELREGQKRFSDIVENAMALIWEVDTRGKFTYVSPVAGKILGYSVDEMLEKHFYDLFHPEDRDEDKLAAFELLARKEPFRDLVNRHVHKNGTTVWVSTSAVPVLDDDGTLLGYRGAGIDITTRREAEEEKAKSRTAMAAAKMAVATIEAMIDMVIITDLEGRIIQFNRALTETLGWGEEVLGKSPAAFVARDDAARVKKGIRDCARKGLLKACRCTALTKDGEERNVILNASVMNDPNGKAMALVGVIREIAVRE